MVKKRVSAFAAGLMNPKRAVDGIRAAAKAGVLNGKASAIFDPGRNLQTEITLKEVLQADVAESIPGVEREAETQIRFPAKDIIEVNKLIETISNACCVLYMGLY